MCSPVVCCSLAVGGCFLGDSASTHLVMQGLYSKIRHPIYIFGTLAFLLVVLALQGWAAIIIWVAVLLIQVARIRREEHVLADAFGEKYVAYRSRTWF